MCHAVAVEVTVSAVGLAATYAVQWVPAFSVGWSAASVAWVVASASRGDIRVA